MRQVIAYADLDSLDSAPFYDGIRDLPHIAVSYSFSRKLQGRHLFNNPITFDRIISSISSDWRSEGSHAFHMCLVSEYIRSRIESAHDEHERVWLEGCYKSTFSILSAIVMLEEADVKPDDLPQRTRNERFLYGAWNHLLNNSSYIQQFHNDIASEQAPDVLLSVLEGSGDMSPGKVIVHGFYFFTPIQERILRMIESLGLEPIFLIPYCSRYCHANEIWTELYNRSNRYEDRVCWELFDTSYSNRFGEILAGNKVSGDGIHLIRYQNNMEFVKGMELFREGDSAIYSPLQREANELLKSFHPEWYGIRNLLSYPVGSFIHALHTMWDSSQKMIRLDPQVVAYCLSTGWISDGCNHSNDYVEDYQKVVSFFDGCCSIIEWQHRLNLLHLIDRDVKSQFEPSFSPEGIHRWKRLMGNPFLAFSMFDLEPERLDALVRMINKLIATVLRLFDGGRRSLADHTSILMDILEQNILDDDVLKEQYRIASKVLDCLRIGHDSSAFEPPDLSNAVNSYLSNEFSMMDEASLGERDWVSPMFNMEGNVTESVHICLCDFDKMPGSPQWYVWPITSDTIDYIEESQKMRDDYPLIGNTRFITENAALANRYLLYRAFSDSNVTLSWVCEVNGKTHSPSPYISLIECMADCPIEKVDDYRSDYSPRVASQGSVPAVVSYSPKMEDMIPESNMEYALCPKRLLYGYILKDHPSFTGDFLQGFAIGGLINSLKAFSVEVGISKDDVWENVRTLFPQLSLVEWRNILDRSPPSMDDQYKVYCGRKYSDRRLDVRFPPPIRKDALKVPNYDVDVIVGYPSKARCKYCPHTHHCPDAVFESDIDD